MDADTCLRCGAPYAPGQTVCFKCGAPLGETRPNTQPVPAIKIPQPEESAPPTRPAAEPAPSLPVARVASATAEPPAPPTQQRRRRWPLIALVVVLVLAAGGGGFYLVRALTAAPPVATQTLYQDPQHRFHFERPTLWAVTTTSDGVTLTDTDGTSTATVTVATPNPGDTAQSRADALATSLGLSAAPSQTIGGDTWEQRTGQFTGTDGAVRQTAVFVTLHNGLLYTIQVTSPVANFSSQNNLVFQPLLASFQFS
jgi:hypothetical protein